MRAVLDKLGVFAFEGARSLLFVADDPAPLRAAQPLFAALQARMARIDIAVAARRAPRGRLAAELPDCHEVPLPWPLRPTALRMLLRVNCKMLIFIGPPTAGDGALLGAAKKRMLPVVVLDPALLTDSPTAPAAWPDAVGAVGALLAQ
ncbi:MAG TPA: hypothetical protein VKN76_05030, partial [Kiloniellaceae bacterium]|nr:hypothetical protein [Kiloniellaceae bacterium]